MSSNVSSIQIRKTDKKLVVEVDLHDKDGTRSLLNILLTGVIHKHLKLSDSARKVISEVITL